MAHIRGQQKPSIETPDVSNSSSKLLEKIKLLCRFVIAHTISAVQARKYSMFDDHVFNLEEHPDGVVLSLPKFRSYAISISVILNAIRNTRVTINLKLYIETATVISTYTKYPVTPCNDSYRTVSAFLQDTLRIFLVT